RRACDQMEAMGHLSWLSTMIAQLGHGLYELGRLDEAYEAGAKAKEASAEDDVATQVHWRRVHAKVLARRGEPDRAELLAREAVALTETTDMVNMQAGALLDFAAVLELAGRRDEAASLLREAERLFETKENLLLAKRTR